MPPLPLLVVLVVLAASLAGGAQGLICGDKVLTNALSLVGLDACSEVASLEIDCQGILLNTLATLGSAPFSALETITGPLTVLASSSCNLAALSMPLLSRIDGSLEIHAAAGSSVASFAAPLLAEIGGDLVIGGAGSHAGVLGPVSLGTGPTLDRPLNITGRLEIATQTGSGGTIGAVSIPFLAYVGELVVASSGSGSLSTITLHTKDYAFPKTCLHIGGPLDVQLAGGATLTSLTIKGLGKVGALGGFLAPGSPAVANVSAADSSIINTISLTGCSWGSGINIQGALAIDSAATAEIRTVTLATLNAVVGNVSVPALTTAALNEFSVNGFAVSSADQLNVCNGRGFDPTPATLPRNCSCFMTNNGTSCTGVAPDIQDVVMWFKFPFSRVGTNTTKIASFTHNLMVALTGPPYFLSESDVEEIVLVETSLPANTGNVLALLKVRNDAVASVVNNWIAEETLVMTWEGETLKAEPATASADDDDSSSGGGLGGAVIAGLAVVAVLIVASAAVLTAKRMRRSPPEANDDRSGAAPAATDGSHFFDEEIQMEPIGIKPLPPPGGGSALDRFGFNNIHYAVVTNDGHTLHAILHELQQAQKRSPFPAELAVRSPESDASFQQVPTFGQFSQSDFDPATSAAVVLPSPGMSESPAAGPKASELLDAGADVNICNMNGQTALHYACIKESMPECVMKLVQFGANVNAVDKDGMTALLYACYAGFTEVVAILLRGGANVNQGDLRGTTPLMQAASQGKVNVFPALMKVISHKPNAKDQMGWTALHWAAAMDEAEATVRLILDENIDSFSTDAHGHTCLHLAVREGNTKTVQRLLALARDPKLHLGKLTKMETLELQTARDMAIASGQLHIVELFDHSESGSELGTFDTPSPASHPGSQSDYTAIDMGRGGAAAAAAAAPAPASAASSTDQPSRKRAHSNSEEEVHFSSQLPIEEQKARRREYMRQRRAREKEALVRMEDMVSKLDQEHHRLQDALQAMRAEAVALRAMLGDDSY